jgi:peptidoglycan/xylan/chitin deacetylase (PgdA/CDA1 family)
VLLQIDTILDKNNHLKVLCFHGFGELSDRYSIPSEVLEDHIAKLKKYADFVGLEELDNAMTGKKYKKTKLLFTVDDGFKNVLEILPIVRKHRIPVVLFVLSNPDRADRKQLHNTEPLLSWKDIKYLHTQGWAIGSHSATHRSFNNLTQKEIQKEIFDSKKLIEKYIGNKVTAFAYPRGVLSTKTEKAVKNAGYKYGFSIDANNVTATTNRYVIPRTIIDKTHTTSEMPAIVTTSWFGIRKLTNRFGLWEKLLK